MNIERIPDVRRSGYCPPRWDCGGAPHNTLYLPEARSTYAKVVELHEYAHVLQAAHGLMKQAAYLLNRAKFESAASAIALAFVKPKLRRQAYEDRIDALQTYLRGDHTLAHANLDNDITKIERLWKEHSG